MEQFLLTKGGSFLLREGSGLGTTTITTKAPLQQGFVYKPSLNQGMKAFLIPHFISHATELFLIDPGEHTGHPSYEIDIEAPFGLVPPRSQPLHRVLCTK